MTPCAPTEWNLPPRYETGCPSDAWTKRTSRSRCDKSEASQSPSLAYLQGRASARLKIPRSANGRRSHLGSVTLSLLIVLARLSLATDLHRVNRSVERGARSASV